MYQPLESPPALLPPKAKLVEVMNERDEPGESMKLLRSMVGGGEEGCGDALARLLGSDPIKGIAGDEEDLAMRVRAYDGNFFAEKRLKTYLELVWDGLHDATLILLMAMAAIVLVTETYFGEHPETGWIEPVVLFISVAIIVNVAASIDYVKERMFHDLSQQLNKSNLKTIVRNGRQLEVEDSEIVVGDVLCFNAHNRASIPADGILVAGDGCKFDESALTGEPEPMHKDLLKNPLVVSGTNAVAGSGRMLVIAVGANSVSGKIRATVYGEDEDEEGSPLFQKLDVRRVAPPRSHPSTLTPSHSPSPPSPPPPFLSPSPPLPSPSPVILPLLPPPPPLSSFAFRTASSRPSYHPGHRAHLATLLRRSPPSCPTPSLSSLLFAGPISSPPLRRRRFRARSPPTPQVLVVQIGKFGGVAAGVCVIAMCVIGFLFTNADADVETKVGSESPLPSTPLFHPSR
jgi:magnesium-transporting ATPase (P-type)